MRKGAGMEMELMGGENWEGPCCWGSWASLQCLVGLWGTALTEDTAGNRELYVKTTLRELLVYIVFLVDICLCE